MIWLKRKLCYISLTIMYNIILNLCTTHSSVDSIFSTLQNFCKPLLSSSLSLHTSYYLHTLLTKLASTRKFMTISSLTFLSEGIGTLNTHPRTDEEATGHSSIPFFSFTCHKFMVQITPFQ